MRPRGLFFWLLNRICKPYNGLFFKQSWLHFSHTIDSRLETDSFIFFDLRFIYCSWNVPIRSISMTFFFHGSHVLQICGIKSVEYT